MNPEYEANEMRRLTTQLRAIEMSPLADRKEARRSYGNALQTPEAIAQAVSWIIDGNYGYAPYVRARQILAMGPRANKLAALCILAAALEWSCPAAMARQAYNALTPMQKKAVTALVAPTRK